MADEVVEKRVGPRMGLWRYCTKYAKQKNAAKKKQQHLENLERRRQGKRK